MAAKTKPKSKAPSEASDIMTLAEAAVYLKVSETGLQAEAERGQIPCRCIDGSWRFSKSGIDAWMQTSASPLPAPKTLPAIIDRNDVDAVIDKIVASRKEGPTASISATFGIWKDDPTAEEMMKRIEEDRK